MVFGDLLALNMPVQIIPKASSASWCSEWSSQSRLVVVAYAERPPKTRIISARLVTPKERRQYENK
jgi:hypothetical protein